MPMIPDPGIGLAIKAAGGVRALARAMGMSHQGITRWHRIPAERVIEIERITGIDRAILRPDLYDK